MKIKMNYLLPFESTLVFNHVSGKLTIVVDTDIIDDEEDFKARIVDEILRTYGICVTRFNEASVPHWEDILHLLRHEMLSRKLDKALSELEGLKCAKAEIERRITKVTRKTEALVAKWRTSIDSMRS